MGLQRGTFQCDHRKSQVAEVKALSRWASCLVAFVRAGSRDQVTSATRIDLHLAEGTRVETEENARGRGNSGRVKVVVRPSDKAGFG